MSPQLARAGASNGGNDGAATVLQSEPEAHHGIQPGALLVNTYRVERLLGGGGMGEVYLARHAGLGTEHAVKVIRPGMAADRQVMGLFYREAKVLRGVHNDAVVSYDGFVRDERGRDYLLMEYVEGPSLADRLQRGPLSPAEVLILRDRLAHGLAEAHRKGAVHRDIAPDNVILPGGRIAAAKLIDFGVCKLTDPAQQTIVGPSFVGKYRFASPEQFGLFGGAVDARSDIYSLGLVLAAAAQGRPLDMGATPAAALDARQRAPDLSGVPASLRDWLSAMLEPDPAQRPATLDALLEHWPGTSSSGSHAATVWRSKAMVLAVAVAFVVAAGGGLYRLWPRPRSDDIPALMRAGRLDDAFKYARRLLVSGQPPPVEDTWALARALRAAGQLNEGFALARELANGGFGPAAYMLAEMYDPLSRAPSPLQPNAAKAREWYGRAAESGVAQARDRLRALEAQAKGR